MKLPVCPSCQKVQLSRYKVLKKDDPDCGREYVGCPSCSARWFMDDPNRPEGVDTKRRQSIWKTLSTWGSPHNEPDAFGVLHPMTYVFPPRHEYPSPFIPSSSTPRQSVVISSAKSQSSKSSTHPESASQAIEQPASPPPQESSTPTPSQHLSASPKSAHKSLIDHPPPPEQNITTEPLKDAESHKSQISSQDSAQIPSDPSPNKDADQKTSPAPEPALPGPTVQHSPQFDQNSLTPSSASALNMNSEEQARFDLLSRIVNSPLPPFLNNSRADIYEPSDHQSVRSEKQQPAAIKNHPEPLSPEEQHLHETLLRVVATPLPTSPRVYTSHILSPRVVLKELAGSDPYAEDQAISAHAHRIAERIEKAIQQSPFIPFHNLHSPRSSKGLESHKSFAHKSPASKHPALRSPPHAASRSVPGTPRMTRMYDDYPAPSLLSTPRTPEAEDELLLPGAFPTPKSTAPKLTPLTSEALDRLGRQFPRHGASLRSAPLAASLPRAPSTYASVPVPRASKRLSLASPGRSTLFN